MDELKRLGNYLDADGTEEGDVDRESDEEGVGDRDGRSEDPSALLRETDQFGDNDTQHVADHHGSEREDDFGKIIQEVLAGICRH